MKRLFLIFILISSCNKSRGKIDLPLLITKDVDSIVSENSVSMLPSSPIVYNINFKDTLNMKFNNKFDASDFSDFEIFSNIHDSIKVFVDNKYIDFHTDEFDILNDIPPPPPPPQISDSAYNKETKEYDNLYVYDTILAKKYIEEAKLKIKYRKNIHYKTYPVYIYNYGNQKTVIQKPIPQQLFMLLEAKNKNNEWKPIEYLKQYGFLCGTGHEDYFLKPKHFLLTTVKKYQGNYKTKLRVKFRSFDQIHYSNEYDGYINYSQFDSKEIINQTHKRLQHKDSLTLSRKLKGLFLRD